VTAPIVPTARRRRPPTRRGSRRRGGRHVLAPLALVAAVGAVTAACRRGGDPEAAVASVPDTTTTTAAVVVDPTKPQTATGANGNPRDERIGPPASNRPSDGQLGEGACFNEFLAAQGEQAVHQVATVDCAQPHDGEVFAVLAIEAAPTDAFPGETAVGQQAASLCLARFQPFVGLEYATSRLRIAVLRPTAGTWARPDRTVVCSVYDQALEPLVGSVRSSGR
jgi:hypothetical protein